MAAGDKLATVSFFSARGYGHPFPEILHASGSYPFVYKARTGGFGEEVEIIHSAEQQQAFESKVDTIRYSPCLPSWCSQTC